MYKIAVAQICSTSAVQVNGNICCSLIMEAALNGAKAIFFPEASDFIASKLVSSSLVQPLDGSFVNNIRNTAKENGIIVSIGIHESSKDDDQKFYNSHLLIGECGNLLGVYRKTHLFDVDVGGPIKYKESDTTLRGNEILDPISTIIGRIGLATCYDIRFPEYSMKMRINNAEILTFPSAFTPETGKAHWHTLVRTRAIETQCYVIASAQVGTHYEGRSTFGHALIVDPWGKVLADCGTKMNCLEFAMVDHTFLGDVRAKMPILNHRRTDLY